jgi:hypothetical protein
VLTQSQCPVSAIDRADTGRAWRGADPQRPAVDDGDLSGLRPGGVQGSSIRAEQEIARACFMSPRRREEPPGAAERPTGWPAVRGDS